MEVSGVTTKGFPSGRITIRPWLDALLRDLIDAPAGDGQRPHPLWALTGALRGLDTDIDGILALADFDASQGPLFASCDIDYSGPLRFDVEYAIAGRVIGLEPKVGRRTGPFDLFTFELDLEQAGTRITRVTFAWVLPRRARP
jgi:hypothetical protein